MSTNAMVCHAMQVSSLVSKQSDSIPELAVTLHQLSQLLQREVSTIMSLNTDAMDGSRPHIKACLERLHVLEEVLMLTPPQVTVQYSTSPQARNGDYHCWILAGCIV